MILSPYPCFHHSKLLFIEDQELVNDRVAIVQSVKQYSYTTNALLNGVEYYTDRNQSGRLIFGGLCHLERGVPSRS